MSVTSAGGLAVLGPRNLGVRDALDQTFASWGTAAGADPMAYPPLLRTDDLEKLDYWKNFPHLALLAAGARHDRTEHLVAAAPSEIPGDLLEPAQYALPSAACYAVYLDLAQQQLSAPRKITTVSTCFRREDHFDGLRRLLGFSMREVVCLGDRETVLEHVSTFKERIRLFAERLDLPLAVQPATDPFFEQDAARTLMQQLFPVKEEFVYGDGLAIASVNFHRNFFGERCEITQDDGSPVFTSCVAFGLERWLAALTDRFGIDCPDLPERIRAAAP
ncbi:aminoacyl--tRNA ligase-related protein [Streptomyces sp. NPDC054765]